MTITAKIWDKVSPINGKDAVFLTEHFKKQNGNDDRVLIAYDGVISRIQQVDDREFDDSDKAYMQGLTSGGMNTAEAIAAAWERKVQQEFEQGLIGEELDRLYKELSDTDYKIVKCMEYQLAGLPAPYDVTALHETRQSARDKINEFEDA